jgi:dTDP-glucose 4,6-dehydratase
MKYGNELEDRKVLVTGANGFIGSHLVEILVDQGANVLAFVEAGSDYQNLCNVRNEIDIFPGDLQDPVSVRKAVRRLSGHRKVLVFHLGAQAHVGDSWNRPHETIRTNVIGTLNLLEAIRDLEVDVAKFNTAGSSEEYGNFDERRKDSYRKENDEVLLNEESPLKPKSIYATSKVAADFLTQNYNEAYDIPTVTTRMFNNFGPRQSPRYITGTVITQALKNNVVKLGNLQSKRDMCFVDDGVRGHIHATLKGKPGQVYTFGQGKNIKMRNWVEKIIRIGKEENYWGDIEVVQTEDRFRPGDSEVQNLCADYGKLSELTGWKPQAQWREGLQRTIKWYANNEKQWLNMCDWR